MTNMTFSNTEKQASVCNVVKIGSGKGLTLLNQMTVSTVPVICEPFSSLPIYEHIDRYEHLRDLDLAGTMFNKVVQPELLIGIDHYRDLVTGEVL